MTTSRLRTLAALSLSLALGLARAQDNDAVDPDPPRSLVILEVRRRGRRDFGLAEETLDRRKRRALRRAIATLLDRGTLADGTSLPALPWRVDLVAIDLGPDGRPSIRHHRGIHP